MASMRKRVIDADGFEAKFRQDIDPWNYAHSAFEAYKRGVLMRAVGVRHFGRGLELACAIGETTRLLAPRCLRLLALDFSDTALREAKRRTGSLSNVALAKALLPVDMPRGPFDLIVASEILYYLRPNDLRSLIVRLECATSPGGRVVILHHLRNFDDAAIFPSFAQQTAMRHLGRRMRLVFTHDDARFQAVAFLKSKS